MEKLEEYAIGKGFELGGKVLSYILGKIWDFTSDKVPKIKYKKILDNTAELADNFLYFFDLNIKAKKDYKNDNVFKKFDIEIIYSIINEIFKKENMNIKMEEKIKEDINNFSLDDASNNFTILLIVPEKKVEDKILKELSDRYKIEKINENEFSFKIKFKDNFKNISKINIIKYNNINDFKKHINCVWYFPKTENIPNKDESIEKINELNLPIIYVYQKEQISKNKLLKIPKEINIENDEIIHNFNKSVIEIDDKDKNLTYLIQKSIFIKIIKNFEKYIINKSKVTLENIIKNIHFDSGNKIDNINILIGHPMKNLFSSLIFNDKKISDFAKSKNQELLNKYKEYLKGYENSYFSEFIKKNGSEYISLIKDKSSLRNILSNKMGILSIEQKELLEILDEFEHNNIDFIEQIDINKKDNSKDDKNINDFNDQLRIKFNDYYIHKASLYIIELVTIIIKDTLIKYYKLSTIQYFIDLYDNEVIFLNETKEK